MKYEYIDRTNKITDEDIINDLLHVKNNILKKETLIQKEYFAYGKYGRKAIDNHFGSWNNLLDKLNIPKTRINEHLSKEDIFLIIENLWIELKMQPTLRQFESMTNHTKKIIVSNFGKWSDCLKEFVGWANSNDRTSIFTQTATIKHNTPREPSASLRNKVLKRDKYKCVICGRSPSSSNVELHLDHIHPYSLGGETVLENLQTLCSDCNLGKSNKID